MNDCIFCKIVKGDIPANKVYEDDRVLAFKDINPQAPTHVLVIPKEHYTSIMEVPKENLDIVSHIHGVIIKLAQDLGIGSKGFRIVNNCGIDGGQTVSHIHFHILGGRGMKWPPG